MSFFVKSKRRLQRSIKKFLVLKRRKQPGNTIPGVFMAIIACVVVTLAPLEKVQAAEDLATVSKILEQNSAHFKSFFSHEQSAAIRNIMGVARAVYLSPEVTTAGFLVGLEKGKGMLLRRHGQAWSDPVFMSLTEYSAGFQAGVKESALIMLIMTDAAVDNIVKGLKELGGTGGFALGNLGLGTSGAGGIHSGLEVLTVTTAKGAYLGSGLAETKLSEINEFNQAVYGIDYDIAAILSKEGGKFKTADGLRSHLKEVVIQSWAQ
jgi:SH3 domain-containing YSC84-like protein 1